MEDWESLRREGKTFIWTALKLQDYKYGMDHNSGEQKFGLFSTLDKNFPGEKEWCTMRGPLEFQYLWENLFLDHLETGFGLSDIILLSLGIEMCLKSIFLLEKESKPRPDHDLYGHFDVLKQETKEVLRERYTALFFKLSISRGLRENWLKFDADKIDAILEGHRYTFTKSRYLYERGGFSHHPILFRMAALAIVDYITKFRQPL